MRKRSADAEEARPVREVAIPVDPINEFVVIAAALADAATRINLARRLQPDHFLVEQHRAIWTVIQEMARKGLDYDPATFQTVAAGRVDTSLVLQLAEMRPDVPANLDFHVDAVFWDRMRAGAAQGPIAALLESLRNPTEIPERVRALSRQVAMAFDGHGERRHLHDPVELVRSQMVEIQKRVDGHACFPYGIAGLDHDGEENRMIPGAAPGQITVITGCSGSGKSTMTGSLTLGIARTGRRICYGAWEMSGGMTLELLACLSLQWSRTALMVGRLEPPEIVTLEERMHAISKAVTIMRNPFRRGMKEKNSNERNLDVLQGALIDAQCDVFVGDLWKRCLVDASPEAEEEALYRQQAMCEELGIHAILLQQQRLKDIEQRSDKRPTREGIKGSGAWTEVADTIIGLHRPAQWKRITDDKIEAFILKQRYGRWPLGIEFDWDADKGQISGGRAVEYDAVAVTQGDVAQEFMRPELTPGGRKRGK